jgi:glycosyltransferase involved in cell wall biosynthesis
LSVRRILFVLDHLSYSSHAAQARLLALTLPAGGWERRVFVTGKGGPWSSTLVEAGVPVEAPGRGRWFDLHPLARLRSVVREFAPDAVHVFGASALHYVALTGFKGRLVASPCPRHDFGRSRLRWLDGWLLRKAHHVVAFGAEEAERCRRWGVDATRLVTVNPAVRAESTDTAGEVSRPYLLCVGPLEMNKGFQDAVWAFDILRYIHPDLHLYLVGEGPERERLPVFIDGLEATDFVHFSGPVPTVFPYLRGAAAVWSPGRVETGSQVVLEAMAAGVPVVAARFPRLAELIVDGETGFLVPPDDKPRLARQTQVLLTDPALRARMGEAARRRAEERFRPETLAETCATLYKG